jgi:hexulose-6-phosphate isomerase
MTTRREFLAAGAAAVALSALRSADAPKKPKLRKAVKYGMIGVKGTPTDKFNLIKKLGFQGVEIDSPSGLKLDEVVAASKETGILVHGVIDSVHWNDTLSHPDEKVRAKGLKALEGALNDAKTVGA